MKDKKVVLFDLDGTITNSAKGIYNSIRYALQKFGITEEADNVLRPFIGPPLKFSFEKHYFSDIADVELAVKYYREYYVDMGIFENELYPGINELLEALMKNDKQLGIASSKPLLYIKKIVNHFNINHFFEHIEGARLDGSMSDKYELIKQNITYFKKFKRNDFVMVGDRDWDIIGAMKNNIDAIGALYGFGDKAELERAGAGFFAVTTNDLRRMLLFS